MQSRYRRCVLFLLVFAMASTAYASVVSASILVPADCMMHMMDDDESPMDAECECSMCDTQCQRCGMDFAHSASIILLTLDSHNVHVNGGADYASFVQPLDSLTLKDPSPPPIT